jgi:flagellar motor component MotA
MSDHHYETRQLSLWDEYKDLNGTLSMDAFMERHVRANAYIVNLMRLVEWGKLPESIDRAAQIEAAEHEHQTELCSWKCREHDL